MSPASDRFVDDARRLTLFRALAAAGYTLTRDPAGFIRIVRQGGTS